MGKLGNTTASAAECLEEYRRNRGKYLPMVDHEKRYFPLLEGASQRTVLYLGQFFLYHGSMTKVDQTGRTI